MAVKATFTLDETTIRRLENAARRLALPKSQVIREAVHDYYDRIGRMTEAERMRWLRVFDEGIARIPRRPQREAERELREIRRSRRAGGRRS